MSKLLSEKTLAKKLLEVESSFNELLKSIPVSNLKLVEDMKRLKLYISYIRSSFYAISNGCLISASFKLLQQFMGERLKYEKKYRYYKGGVYSILSYVSKEGFDEIKDVILISEDGKLLSVEEDMLFRMVNDPVNPESQIPRFVAI